MRQTTSEVSSKRLFSCWWSATISSRRSSPGGERATRGLQRGGAQQRRHGGGRREESTACEMRRGGRCATDKSVCIDSCSTCESRFTSRCSSTIASTSICREPESQRTSREQSGERSADQCTEDSSERADKAVRRTDHDGLLPSKKALLVIRLVLLRGGRHGADDDIIQHALDDGVQQLQPWDGEQCGLCTRHGGDKREEGTGRIGSSDTQRVCDC